MITGGHRLPARYVIHAVGPVWRGGGAGEPAVLRSAYARAFALARLAGDVRSIAFPAISTGVYGYPVEPAARLAVDTVRSATTAVEQVTFVAFGAPTVAAYEAAL